MKKTAVTLVCFIFVLTPRGDSQTTSLSGELRKWRPVTLTFHGPDTSETAAQNPFADYRLTVRFSHEGRTVAVPGFFAADGDAAESGAESGSVWKAIFVPDEQGKWEYVAEFRTAPGIAVASEDEKGQPADFDGTTGSFEVGPIDKNAPGFLAKGMLCNLGSRYPQFVETKEYFIKGGADSPENVLAFADFDGTTPTHRFDPHAGDWKEGDPTWRGGKGKNLIGALNYLASKGVNSVYFLTMNVGGDGNDVWPWAGATDRSRFDCSKLDQWEIVFSHMDRLGLMLHVVQQEQENDQLLDGGDLGPERRLYYRELVARFAHHPALVWNLGEENTNTDEQRKAFAEYTRSLDPYDHPIVVHTYPSEYENIYRPLLGFAAIDGPSLQIANMKTTHDETLKWVSESARSGHPWMVCLDEIGPPDIGVKPDSEDPAHDDVRRFALWGNLMAGGAGCEWFFQPDVGCEDWRSRDAMWDLTRIALTFFQRDIPFVEMEAHDELVHGGNAWCLAKPGDVYAVYAATPAECRIKLAPGEYDLFWYDPRKGGALQKGGVIRGGESRELGTPPADGDKDWAAVIRSKRR
ncbi:MAG: DUF5060 domain-containing protein [Candidatus Hydrogenedentes bacterium]|nr:DUF5060 domain-containing protein [Candidatus Hydrogenedentota bacterium]